MIYVAFGNYMIQASQLPAEIACFVFEPLCFSDRISATHVCKRWRSVALAHELLWARVRCQHPSILEALLDRARHVPVDVQVFDIYVECLEYALEVVASHLYHIRSLVLQAEVRFTGFTQFPTVYRCLATPAPLMESLDIQLFEHPFIGDSDELILDNDPRCALPFDLFREQAPRLKKLSFCAMTLADDPRTIPALSSISALELNVVYLSAAQLLAIVSLPHLRSLHLETFDCEVPDDPAPPGLQLQNLWITGPTSTEYFGPQPCPLLRYLGFPHIKHFASGDHELWLTTMESSPRSQPHTLLIEPWLDEYESHQDGAVTEAWRLIGGSGFVSDLLDVHTLAQFSWPDAQHVLSNLVDLLVPYKLLRLADLGLNFPTLTRLRVRVDEDDFFYHLKPGFPAFTVPCPKLRTLELWDGGVTTEGSLSMADTLDFVQNVLSFDKQRPPELIVWGVYIGTAADDWRALEGSVSGIREMEGPPPAPFLVELRSLWHTTVQD